MGRRRRDGNHSPQKIIQYRIQWEMKKMDTQLLTSTKQGTLLRNSAMATKNPQRRNLGRNR
jgi:hypothetical protein